MGGAFAIPVSMMGGMDEEKARKAVEDREKQRLERFPKAQTRAMLADALAVLDKKYSFKRGDVVRYKRGLENNRLPPCGGLALFLTYAGPRYQMERADYGHPLATYDVDCVIGVLLPNGALAEYHCCSRYLEPAPASEDGEPEVSTENENGGDDQG
jgi:hypothetical protein